MIKAFEDARSGPPVPAPLSRQHADDDAVDDNPARMDVDATDFNDPTSGPYSKKFDAATPPPASPTAPDTARSRPPPPTPPQPIEKLVSGPEVVVTGPHLDRGADDTGEPPAKKPKLMPRPKIRQPTNWRYKDVALLPVGEGGAMKKVTFKADGTMLWADTEDVVLGDNGTPMPPPPFDILALQDTNVKRAYIKPPLVSPGPPPDVSASHDPFVASGTGDVLQGPLTEVGSVDGTAMVQENAASANEQLDGTLYFSESVIRRPD